MSGPWEKYAKPTAADGPWAKYSGAAPAETEKAAPDAKEAALQGLGQGLSFRYLPELQAATAKPMEKILDLFGGGDIAKGDEALAAQGIAAPEDTYAKRLAENRARDKDLSRSGAYTAGELGGSIVSTAIPGLGVAKAAKGASLLRPAASFGGKVAQSVAGGAAQGAAVNPEEGSRAENALYGGLAGSLGQTAASGFSKAGTGIKKLLGAATGIGEKPIETYVARGGQVEDLISKYGDDAQSAARDARKDFVSALGAKKQEMRGRVKEILKPSEISPVEYAEAAPLFKRAQGIQESINPRTSPDSIAEFQDLLKPLKSVTQEGDRISLSDLNDLKTEYQKMAKSAYKGQGKFAGKGDDFANQAKLLGGEAMTLLDARKPEVRDINKKLSRFYELDAQKGNLLNPDAEASQLIQAGSRPGKDRQILSELGDFAGKDFLTRAEDIAAQKAFANPNPLSAFNTGRSVLGATLGGAAGAAGGDSGSAGEAALIGAAISNPAILKQVLKGSNAIKLPAAYGAVKGGVDAMNPYIAGAATERLRELLNK